MKVDLLAALNEPLKNDLQSFAKNEGGTGVEFERKCVKSSTGLSNQDISFIDEHYLAEERWLEVVEEDEEEINVKDNDHLDCKGAETCRLQGIST